MKIMCHCSYDVDLPFTRWNGYDYGFFGFEQLDQLIRLHGIAGGRHKGVNTNIDVYSNGDILVYDTKQKSDKTNFYHKSLIKEFIKFFQDNIDIENYMRQQTNTGAVILSQVDTLKIKNWAKSNHHFTSLDV